MRKKLQEERTKRKLTQQQMAAYLGISERAYQRIESADTLGKIEHWDKLEDFFNVSQRQLRENFFPQESPVTLEKNQPI